MRDTSSYIHVSFACSCQNLEWDIKRISNFVREILQKKSKWALLNRLRTKDSYMEPDGIILNFKHGKIETNWTSPTISFVHLETQGLFLLYNEHLSFSLFSFLDYFLMSFYVLFLHLCVISSVIRFKQVKFTVVKKKNWPASISIWYLRVKEISGIYIYIYKIFVSIY